MRIFFPLSLFFVCLGAAAVSAAPPTAPVIPATINVPAWQVQAWKDQIASLEREITQLKSENRRLRLRILGKQAPVGNAAIPAAVSSFESRTAAIIRGGGGGPPSFHGPLMAAAQKTDQKIAKYCRAHSLGRKTEDKMLAGEPWVGMTMGEIKAIGEYERDGANTTTEYGVFSLTGGGEVLLSVKGNSAWDVSLSNGRVTSFTLH